MKKQIEAIPKGKSRNIRSRKALIWGWEESEEEEEEEGVEGHGHPFRLALRGSVTLGGGARWAEPRGR